MGNYNLPVNPAQLITLGTRNVVGMKALSATLGITLITTAECESNLAGFISANNNYNTARSARQTASTAYQLTLGPIYDWLLGVSNTLATRFGTQWSTQWAQAGFINNTTAIPAKIDDRMTLTLALVDFFTTQPGYEVPSMNQTAAYGTTLREAALAGQTILTDKTVSLNDAGTAWETAFTALQSGMLSLLRNLSEVLKDNDTRWLIFGFQMPGSPSTPGQPQNLSAAMGDAGAILVQNDATALATRYRYRMMIVGVDTAYKLAASSLEPMAQITGIEPGRTVQLIVQAVNGNLQGVASDPIQFTVLLPVAKAPEAKAAGMVAAEAPELKTNGNGNGHRGTHATGNGAPSRVG